MNENTNTTENTNTAENINTNEKGNEMNENTNTNSNTYAIADEMNDKRGYWMNAQTVELRDENNTYLDTFKYVPFASVIVGYVPEYIADKWNDEHAHTINPRTNDEKSGCVQAWEKIEAYVLSHAVMVKAPTFYYDGMRIDGITDATQFVAPNEKGRYSRADACGRVETLACRSLRGLFDRFMEWMKADNKRTELNEKDAKKRADERKRAEIDGIAAALIAAKWEPEAAEKRARKLYAETHREK